MRNRPLKEPEKVLKIEQFKVAFLRDLKREQKALPIKAGYLKKMSPHLLQGWQDRYIKLEDMQLSWSAK